MSDHLSRQVEYSTLQSTATAPETIQMGRENLVGRWSRDAPNQLEWSVVPGNWPIPKQLGMTGTKPNLVSITAGCFANLRP